MENKKEDLYIDVFKKFKEITGRNIDILHSDAELAMTNAVKKVFPNCAIKLCTCHFHRHFFPKIPGLAFRKPLEDLRCAIVGFVHAPWTGVHKCLRKIFLNWLKKFQLSLMDPKTTEQ